MNFNFNANPEYNLNTSLIEEVINLYGIPTKFLVASKINLDSTVFGDYSHLKTDNTQIYDIYMLPENTEDWDSGDYGFNPFGITNMENITLFAAKSSFSEPNMDELGEIVGNLIVLPNNKIMEITDIDITTPGVNNLFTYDNAKSVYKLVCKPYDFKLINELDNVDISVDPLVPYDTLDTYFQELIDTGIEQDTEAEVTPQVQTIDKTGGIDTVTTRPIVDNTEDDVFGNF